MGAEMACVALIRGLGSATLVAGDKHLGDKRTPKRETGGRAASRERAKESGGVAHQEVIMWLSAPDRLARARAALGRRLLVWNSKRARAKRKEQS
jgi:hypothetical protein